MLGTLAKWLRILGFDTIYDSALDDNQLARLARSEGRVLLTRDQELARRRGIRSLLVAEQDLEGQIEQVLSDLGLTPDRTFSRCPVCNGLLAPLDRETARGRVPAYISKTQKTFKQCPACQRIYWRGTHWQQMNTKLENLETQGSSTPAGAVPDEAMI
jgi:uncharacterized protein with PIN domain